MLWHIILSGKSKLHWFVSVYSWVLLTLTINRVLSITSNQIPNNNIWLWHAWFWICVKALDIGTADINSTKTLNNKILSQCGNWIGCWCLIIWKLMPYYQAAINDVVIPDYLSAYPFSRVECNTSKWMPDIDPNLPSPNDFPWRYYITVMYTYYYIFPLWTKISINVMLPCFLLSVANLSISCHFNSSHCVGTKAETISALLLVGFPHLSYFTGTSLPAKQSRISHQPLLAIQRLTSI